MKRRTRLILKQRKERLIKSFRQVLNFGAAGNNLDLRSTCLIDSKIDFYTGLKINAEVLEKRDEIGSEVWLMLLGRQAFQILLAKLKCLGQLITFFLDALATSGFLK